MAIFIVTNKATGYTYIGKHRIKKGEGWLTYMGGGLLITASVNKYGKELFTKELVDYADTLDELDRIEDEYIKAEVNSGKAQYNIQGTDNKADVQIRKINVTDEELLYMFFDKKMSGRAIDKELNLPIGTVYYYLVAKYGETDSRFKDIKQGEIRDPELRKKINENVKSGTKASQVKIQCEHCFESFVLVNIGKHIKTCLMNKEYTDTLPKCIENDCDNFLKGKKKGYCREHYIKYSKNGKSGGTSESNSRGACTQYHVNRSLYIELCSYCLKYCIENNINLTVTKSKLIELFNNENTIGNVSSIFKVSFPTASRWKKQLISEDLL